MDNGELLKYIKELCAQRNLTIPKLAERAGVCKQTIYNLERCDSDGLSKKVAEKVAGVLGCSATILMRLEGKSKEATASKTNNQTKIAISGGFAVIPQADGTAHIIAKDFRLQKRALKEQAKLFLFGSSDISDDLLNEVRSFALELLREKKS